MITGGSENINTCETLSSLRNSAVSLTVDFEPDRVVLDGVGEDGVLGAAGEHLVVVLHRRPQLEDRGRHVAVEGDLPMEGTKWDLLCD